MDTEPKDPKPDVQVHCMQEDRCNDERAKEQITLGLINASSLDMANSLAKKKVQAMNKKDL